MDTADIFKVGDNFELNSTQATALLDLCNDENKISSNYNIKSSVHAVTYEQRDLAVKRVHLTDDNFKRECLYFKLLSEYQRPDIVRCFGFSSVHKLITLELAQCSLQALLFDKVREKAQPKSIIDYSIGNGIMWCEQIASAIAFLHSVKVPVSRIISGETKIFNRSLIHRDIKGDNVLLFDFYRKAKIADFEMVRPIETRMSIQGTIRYMAPEVKDSLQYNEKCDVYSTSIVFKEILTRSPYTGNLRGVTCKPIVHLLCSKCIQANENERPSMKTIHELCQHVRQFCEKNCPNLLHYIPKPINEEFHPPPYGTDAFISCWEEVNGTHEELLLQKTDDINGIRQVYVVGEIEKGKQLYCFDLEANQWSHMFWQRIENRMGGAAAVLFDEKYCFTVDQPIPIATMSLSTDTLNTVLRPAFAKSTRGLIGQGAFGHVYQIDCGMFAAAVKVVPDENEFVQREIKAVTEVMFNGHPNIISVYGHWSDGSRIYIAMELAHCSLNDLLFKEYDYSFGNAVSWCKQVADAVAFLHQLMLPDRKGRYKPMLHRDIKPANILLFEKFQVVKISDFGLARVQETLMTIGAGTLRYMAPEVLFNAKYSAKCDVYSAGVVFWEIFHSTKFHVKAMKDLSEDKVPGTPLYFQCLNMDPLLRPAMGFISNLFGRLLERCKAEAHELTCFEPKPASGSLPAPSGAELFTSLLENFDHGYNKERLILVGGQGYYNKQLLTTVDIIDLKMKVCKSAEILKLGRLYCDAVAIDNGRIIMVAGGENQDGDVFNSVEGFTCCNDTLRRLPKHLPSMNLERSRLALAVMINYVPNVAFAIGGDKKQASKISSEYLDMAQMKWCKGPDLVEARKEHAASVLENTIYITGGDNTEKRVECLDHREGRWRKHEKEMIHPRKRHRLLAVDDSRLFAIGGYQQATVETFDAQKNEWIEGVEIPATRSWFQAAVC